MIHIGPDCEISSPFSVVLISHIPCNLLQPNDTGANPGYVTGERDDHEVIWFNFKNNVIKIMS